LSLVVGIVESLVDVFRSWNLIEDYHSGRHTCRFYASELLVVWINSKLVEFVDGLHGCYLVMLNWHFWQLAFIGYFLSSLTAQPLYSALTLRQQVSRSFLVELLLHYQVGVFNVVCVQIVVVETSVLG